MSVNADFAGRPGSIRLADLFHAKRAELRARRAQRAEYRRVYDELNRLDDRDLRDIGLHRSDVERIARDSAALV